MNISKGLEAARKKAIAEAKRRAEEQERIQRDNERYRGEKEAFHALAEAMTPETTGAEIETFLRVATRWIRSDGMGFREKGVLSVVSKNTNVPLDAIRAAFVEIEAADPNSMRLKDERERARRRQVA
jgi:hypothetical protein